MLGLVLVQTEVTRRNKDLRVSAEKGLHGPATITVVIASASRLAIRTGSTASGGRSDVVLQQVGVVSGGQLLLIQISTEEVLAVL
jgi:hypothetical protein